MNPFVKAVRNDVHGVLGILALLSMLAAPAAWASVTVALTSPTDGSQYNPGENIILTASASAGGNYTISQVEFFYGTTLIGTDTSAPYSVNWNDVPQGNHALTAKATAIKKNSPNETATSAPRNIIVAVPPLVSMTSPANGTGYGATFSSPANVPVSATATDSDGMISKVVFEWTSLPPDSITGETTVYQPPYNAVLQLPLGAVCGTYWCSYDIIARAHDNQGAFTRSSPVSVTVAQNSAPTVNLVSPAPNASFSAPASIDLQAQAADPDGWISSVEFYNGSTLITTIASAPYNFSWTGVPQGTYSLTARAIDNLGMATISAPVNVTVTEASAAGFLYFIHADHLNTPRLITNQGQQAVWRWDQQEPFGINLADENPSNLGIFEFPMRFPGQYADKETNLYYNLARDYDAAVGRYVQSDPIGLQGGSLSPYVYVNNSPLSAVDPLGLVNWKGTFGGVAGIKVVGAGFFRFSLESECKCNKRLRIKGYVSTVAAGIGAKFTGTGATAEFYDNRDCPEADVANGGVAILSAGLVYGGGFSCSKMTVGHLYSNLSCGGPAYGYDASAGVYIGASAVTEVTEECCQSK